MVAKLAHAQKSTWLLGDLPQKCQSTPGCSFYSRLAGFEGGTLEPGSGFSASSVGPEAGYMASSRYFFMQSSVNSREVYCSGSVVSKGRLPLLGSLASKGTSHDLSALA